MTKTISGWIARDKRGNKLTFLYLVEPIKKYGMYHGVGKEIDDIYLSPGELKKCTLKIEVEE